MRLPVCIQIFLQLSGVEHLVAEHLALLQWGDVLAHTVVELGVVAGGEQVVNLLAELLQFGELGFQLLCLHAALGGGGVKGVEAVADGGLAVGGIDGAHAVEGVAIPFVDAHVQLHGVVAARREMPDEWGLGQIHEKVQMVAELLEEAFLQVLLQRAAQQLAHLVELCW